MLFKELKKVLPRDQLVSLFVSDPNGSSVFGATNRYEMTEDDDRAPIYTRTPDSTTRRPKPEDCGEWIIIDSTLDKLDQPHYIPGYFNEFNVEIVTSNNYIGRRNTLFIKLSSSNS